MTQEEVVVDTKVFIVSLLEEYILDTDARKQRPLAQEYIDGLQSGRYLVHLPRIAIVEITGVIRKRAGPGIASAIRTRLGQWVNSGLIRLYDLDEDRMRSATELVMLHNLSKRRSLSVPDATFVCLAEELGVSLISFEKYFEAVYSRAKVPA